MSCRKGLLPPRLHLPREKLRPIQHRGARTLGGPGRGARRLARPAVLELIGIATEPDEDLGVVRCEPVRPVDDSSCCHTHPDTWVGSGMTWREASTARASARAWSRSWVACWYLRAARGLAFPPRRISSAVVAAVAADQVRPECRRSCRCRSERPAVWPECTASAHMRWKLRGDRAVPLDVPNSHAPAAGSTRRARWSSSPVTTCAGTASVRTPAAVSAGQS
jgi:hypothetical protein